MTATKERSNTSRRIARATWILASLGLAACSTVGEGPQGPNTRANEDPINDGSGGDGADGSSADGTGGADDDGGGGDDGPATIPKCVEATNATKAVFESYCTSCHGADSPGSGGFSAILDRDAMVQLGKVVPDAPDQSSVYLRMESETMPPAGVAKRPSTDDIQNVHDWIACGAPDFNDQIGYGFTDINKRLRTLLDDVRSFENPADRQRIRYIDLTSLANAGYSSDQIDVYREAVSFLVNSLSRGRFVVAPEPVDTDNLLYRIDLRDYNWNADTWELIIEDYPYAVVYDQDSRLFPYDEVTSEQLREETGTNIPYIQADWFISHASRPPLYYDVLEIPRTLAEVEAQLGLDIQANIDNEIVSRTGFTNAGPSRNARMFEHHPLDGGQGSFWLSYDFANNLGDHNLFANPLDFQEDGGEAIFTLPNGLQGYLVCNAAGEILDKAPTNVVQDPLSRDGAVESGLSCITCHQSDGILPKQDEVREYILRTGQDAQEIEQVLALYVEHDVMQSLFEEDQNRYRTARTNAGVSQLGETTFHVLNNTHLDLLDIGTVASVLGIGKEELERALDASPQAFPSEIISLRSGAAVQRDAFESVFDDLVEALGLGTPLTRNSSSSGFGDQQP